MNTLLTTDNLNEIFGVIYANADTAYEIGFARIFNNSLSRIIIDVG
jgi:hypothetical protein